ncbi:glycoside hydrolase family 16 protein [Spirosoma sp. BT702]|uniref:Glycoside hydrolase family 16 protein n=1 Tax=Spirosoma profusum TaxID=2771354 RepID=A0A927ASV1_9BACT|nr:glycoside hydrolase family 16 protein [Spirosoma profusum]MBD2704486.1 glycoside hydrolase family 16 protein [Spirosoma profusum]
MKPVYFLLSIPFLFVLTLSDRLIRLDSLSNVVKPDTAWKLVWSDEFNKAGAPDPKNWKFEQGFVRNHEIQWYQPQNARCENGLLVIEAKREQRPNPTYRSNSIDWKTNRPTITYTSSSLKTSGLHQWQYGRFDMRGRIDIRSGMWPAFWTLGATGEWPANGEIDIMEYYRNMLLANVAWATDTRYKAEWRSVKKPITTFNDADWSKKFHLWRMDWNENSIRLYVDGQLLNEVSLAETINQDGTKRNPFHQPHYLLLNLAIGGDNGGDPVQTDFPARFEVDFVRVYQQ